MGEHHPRLQSLRLGEEIHSSCQLWEIRQSSPFISYCHSLHPFILPPLRPRLHPKACAPQRFVPCSAFSPDHTASH